MDVLILGGTAPLGRAVARHALGRGHAVTCLARGSAEVPDGVRLVRADRDADDALTPVAGRPWDAVIDVARQPGQVRRAVRDLRAGHWVYVSSTSVYASHDRPDRTEDAPLLPPLDADAMSGPEQYGAAKVACEDAVRGAAASATIVRPGLIGGPEDDTGRCGYYPWRFAHPSGPDVLAPADPDFPVAFIDLDDLADWLVDAAERRLDGTFNATGEPVTLARFLDAARAVAGPDAPPPRHVPDAVLQQAGVAEWMGPRSLPLWVRDPAWRATAVTDHAAALAHGLTLRPLAETLARALAFEESRGGPQGSGLSDAEEASLRRLLDSEATS